jgi:hypothetical protein
MPKGIKLTNLEMRLFLKYYLEKREIGPAYQKLRPKVKKHTAETLGSKLLKKVEFNELLDAAGATDEEMAVLMNQGSKAMKVVGAKIIFSKGQGNVKEADLINALSKEDDFIEVEDWAARHKFVETILRVKKKLIDRMALGGGDTGEEPIRVVLDNPNIPEMPNEQ